MTTQNQNNTLNKNKGKVDNSTTRTGGNAQKSSSDKSKSRY
jgi:hypothetical protein